MKTTQTFVLTGTAILCLAACQVASALTITSDSLPQWSGPENSQKDINALIAPIIGAATEVYKQDVGAGSDTGSLAGSYTTTFSNSASDPTDALIKYVSGGIVNPVAWLLVKDGNHSPGWYLFNLTALGWNGIEDLNLTGFWPNQGAISHVTMYGGGGMPGVPDGGATLGLLSLAMLGLNRLRQRLKSGVERG